MLPMDRLWLITWVVLEGYVVWAPLIPTQNSDDVAQEHRPFNSSKRLNARPDGRTLKVTDAPDFLFGCGLHSCGCGGFRT